MQEGTKGDPLIRTLIVIILGSVTFGLLFQIYTGGGTMEDMGMGNMGNMGGMGMSGYSVNGFLGGLLGLLVNLLIIALVVGAVIWAFIWIKRSFLKDTAASSAKTTQGLNDPILKTVGIVVAAVFGLILVFGLFGNFTGIGNMGGYSMANMGGSGMGGFNMGFSLYGLMNLLVKLLAIVLVVSLILAVTGYVKKQYDAGVFSATKNGGTGGNDPGANAGNPQP